ATFIAPSYWLPSFCFGPCSFLCNSEATGILDCRRTSARPLTGLLVFSSPVFPSSFAAPFWSELKSIHCVSISSGRNCRQSWSQAYLFQSSRNSFFVDSFLESLFAVCRG